MSECKHPVTHIEPNGEVVCLVCDQVIKEAPKQEAE